MSASGTDLNGAAGIWNIRVRARVELPPSAITLATLARLEPGLVIHLGIPSSTHAVVALNGYTLAEGRVVRAGDRRAIELTEVP